MLGPKLRARQLVRFLSSPAAPHVAKTDPIDFAMIFIAEYAIIFSFRVLSATLLFNIVPGSWTRAITRVGLAGGVV